MIEIEHLSKHFGPVAALRGVSFSVEKGEVMGLLGPNGAGKTTLMRILTGFLPPSGGRARVAGYDVVRDSLEVRRRVGYFPERVPLYPDMSAATFLDFAAKAKGIARGERRGAIQKALSCCGLGAGVADRRIGHLSKGYRQRVGLAQALLGDPPVVILDEPTIGLDPEQVVEARRLVKGLAEGRTVLLSTHILPEVSLTCQRVAIIHQGRLVAVDRPEGLAARLRGPRRIEVRVEGPREAVRQALEATLGVSSVEERGEPSAGVTAFWIRPSEGADPMAEISATVFRGGWLLRELHQVGPSLEEAFLELIRKSPEGPLPPEEGEEETRHGGPGAQSASPARGRGSGEGREASG